MNRPARSLVTLAVLATFATLAATPAHAGFGDMIKKKAADAMKGGKKPAATTASTAEDGAIKSRIQPPVTPENIAKFKAGMEFEIAERAKAVAFLKTVKSPEAYDKCKMDWMTSTEGQKISKEYVDAMGSAKSTEDVQKLAAAMAPVMEKKIDEKCGPDPSKYNDNWKGNQAREALGKASDDFAKGQGLEPGSEDYAYNAWKEWVAEFCHYLEKLKKDPDYKQKLAKIQDEGLRIPGSGAGIYWVYTASEAKSLIENCDSLMPLIEATI
jgi:hypothetical protein